MGCRVSKIPYLPCGDCWLFWESQSKWAVVLLDILTIPLNCCVGSCSNWAFDVSVARKEGGEGAGRSWVYFISFLVHHLLFQCNCASSPPLFPTEQVKITPKFFSSVPTGVFSRLEQALQPGREGSWSRGWCWKGDQSLGTKRQDQKTTRSSTDSPPEESPFCFLP